MCGNYQSLNRFFLDKEDSWYLKRKLEPNRPTPGGKEKGKYERIMSLYYQARGEFRYDDGFPEKIDNDLHLWLYQDAVYGIDGRRIYTQDEEKLLILESVDRERRKFEQLRNKFSGTIPDQQTNERLRIPEKVRIAVWRRDQGRCAKCGSRVNLEYDHIVPVSRGGSNTERNIELLCQDCNRVKGNRIE
jgi:hypothetical protein